jgi:pyridoxamine 5'-phosphate oxidase-like protein
MTLEVRYSNPGVSPTAWVDAENRLATAEIYWLCTVRPEGRPHVTPLIAVWQDGALTFCTGADERKARNLAVNPACTLTTGTNVLNDGLDMVVEGAAVRVTDSDRLHRLADAYGQKYGSDWHFDVGDGMFLGDGGAALVFAVTPETVFAFGKGEFSQTRWRFS